MDATSIQPGAAQAQIKVDSPIKKSDKATEVVSAEAVQEATASPEGVGAQVDLKV